MSWMSGLRRKFKFSAERLSENAKTISLSPWKQTILQCVTHKSCRKAPNLWLTCFCFSDLLTFWFWMLHFKTCYWLMHFCCKFFVAIYTLFCGFFLDQIVESADFFTLRMCGFNHMKSKARKNSATIFLKFKLKASLINHSRIMQDPSYEILL